MDHLDRPACPRHPRIEVHILYTDELQCQDFMKYRHKMGCTRDDISGGAKSLDERAAFFADVAFLWFANICI